MSTLHPAALLQKNVEKYFHLEIIVNNTDFNQAKVSTLSSSLSHIAIVIGPKELLREKYWINLLLRSQKKNLKYIALKIHQM